MYQLLTIAVGGALGSVLRFVMSQGINQWTGIKFPYGTLCVNVLGCLLIGFLSILFIERLATSPIWRATVLIGFLGGFTTFSSFSLDTFNLFEQGYWTSALLNVVSSLVLCLLATAIGVYIGRNL
jgi:CrcB protein